MMDRMEDIMNPSVSAKRNPAFPYAPLGWAQDSAKAVARTEGLSLNEDHWQTIRALQEYFSRHELGEINVRELHDALDERFHGKGGIKYLYTLLPGGPIAQGCRLAGLEPPAGAADPGFGSVV